MSSETRRNRLVLRVILIEGSANLLVLSVKLIVGLSSGSLAVLAAWQRYWARRLESEILLADANHTFADVLTTVVVIGGWQLAAMGYPWLDEIAALGVAILVLYLAYGLFKRAIPVLVDEIAVEPELLTETIESVAGVQEVRRVRSRWVGASRAVDLIVTVDPKLSTADSHKIADTIEADLEERFNVDDCSIHIEPASELD